MRPEKLYLTDILEAADAIDRFVSDIPFEGFIEDEMRQAAILQKLIVIGEAASRLPQAVQTTTLEVTPSLSSTPKEK
jgi:uncharacterized protein with HEPN domain